MKTKILPFLRQKFCRKVPLGDRRTKGETIFLWALCIIFFGYTVTLFYPVFWTVINSLKSSKEFFKNIYGLPQTVIFENYVEAFKIKVGQANILQMFGNSMIITFAALFIALLECAMTGYIFSMYKFPGSQFIYNLMLLVTLIPLAGSLPSLYRFYVQTGLYDTRVGVILIYTGGFGNAFFIMYNFYETVSWSYGEAAMIDGASDWQIFFRVMLPQSMGMLFALATSSFMGIYADYTNPYMFLKSNPTLAVGITNLAASMQSRGRYPVAFAAMLISCIPTWIFYALTSSKLYNLKIDSGIKG